jgi:signal transduction histidine kinase
MTGTLETQPSRHRGDAFLYRLARWSCLLGWLGAGMAAAGADPGPVKKVIHQYALTSANDFPQRDPQDWRLLASNDGGKTWITLDTRQHEIFQGRQERKLFKIDNQTAFEIYRLQIDKVRDPNEVNSVQLAEIELMGLTDADLNPVPGATDIVSAQGDNPPTETVANLFDGHAETKWLDWPTNTLTRSSWIQWQYAAPTGMVVTNLSDLLALRARAGDGHRVRIEAVVAGRIAPGQSLCFIDATGCVELDGIEGTEMLRPGQKVLISGVSSWAGNQVGLKDGRAARLAAEAATNPARIMVEQPLAPQAELRWVEVEGEIQYRRLTENEFTFDLQDGAHNMRVHLRCPENSHPMPPSGAKVSVRGICQGAFNEQGQWVAADLWAAGRESLSLLDPQTPSPLPAARPTQTRPVSTNSMTLTTIEQIRRLTLEQFKSRPPVKIRGVVTGLLGGFIQDDTAGIEVVFPFDESRKLTELGAYIEVEGSAGLADIGNPMVSADHIVVLGRGKLPSPQKLSLSQLLSGRIDAQWIEVEGVVRSTDGAHLLIICDGRELMATFGVAPAGVVKALVDAEVRVRGVGVTAMDEQGRIQGIHLLIPSLEHMELVEPPRDPALLPVRTIGSLLGLSGPRESFHRVKVEGVVTLQDNQKVFLQDRTGSALAIFKEDVVLDARFGRSRWLYWRTPKATAKPDEIFLPGERVQVVGFPETHRYSPVLTEVTLTKQGVQPALKPVPLTANGIEEGGLDSSLVTLDGVLRGQNMIGNNDFLALEWQDRTLQVLVPGKENEPLKIALGSRLRVTGVCQVDPAPYVALGLGVGAVRIQTGSPEDLVVLARPSWWTIRKALALMGGMGFVILAALIWIKELRRQVEERTVQLSAEIQLRERTEHRHALEQERARIAKDLHDDLGANLTQIVFLSERVEVAQHDGQEATRWFNLIPATARRTIQSLDEIVWAINPRHDSLESLANYLSQFAQEYLTLARMRCVLDVPTVLPSVPLSADVRHNLLLTTREALQNAVTHAAATEVQLTLKLNEDGVSITIADNGKGFDPAAVSQAGNGLQNMRRRLRGIGGRLDINSRPGEGTTIFMLVPQNVLHGRVIGGNGDSSQ